MFRQMLQVFLNLFRSITKELVVKQTLFPLKQRLTFLMKNFSFIFHYYHDLQFIISDIFTHFYYYFSMFRLIIFLNRKMNKLKGITKVLQERPIRVDTLKFMMSDRIFSALIGFLGLFMQKRGVREASSIKPGI